MSSFTICAVVVATGIACSNGPKPSQSITPTQPSQEWQTAPASLAADAGPGRGPFQSTTLILRGGKVDVLLSAGQLAVTRAQLLDWIQNAARAVTSFYGRFPVEHLTLTVNVADDKEAVSHGVTFDGRRIHIQVSPSATQRDLHTDWMLTHEMFHLAFPNLAEQHIWMNEGLSTYLEPLARARIGNLAPEQLWGDIVRDMPQGLPEPGDNGLDHTHTWGRTYWGGCMFWLLADVQIREQTHGRHMLDDALRAILAAGGDGSQTWTVDRIIEVADTATQTTVVKDLYAKVANESWAPDLNDLWRRLGIKDQHGKIVFGDTAPLAGIRKSLTSARAMPPTP